MPLSKFMREYGASVVRLDDVAPLLSAEQPYFKMRSGGTYAVVVSGGKPVCFIRVDKNRRPRRERKRMRRMALTLAKATV